MESAWRTGRENPRLIVDSVVSSAARSVRWAEGVAESVILATGGSRPTLIGRFWNVRERHWILVRRWPVL